MRSWKFNHIDFSTYPAYEQNDLGVFWSPEKTTFRVWAPTARKVELRLYKQGVGGEHFHKTNLQKAENGTWLAVLTGDYDGKFYTFRVNDGEWLEEVPDVFARCVGVNGLRGMIFNPKKTNPANWIHDHGPKVDHITDAVIYETHVRDLSIAENSGIKNKGKFFGFTEDNTKSPTGVKTGLSHLVELGVTHVHLLPVNDFVTVNEEKPLEKYNWGYDPQHFNALEGSYSNDPFDGRKRIFEFKSLVKALHDKGIGVILDVVFNHTFYARESVFNQIVPGYYYRQKRDGSFANASGCGNEIASERYMVRKYIINTLRYWVEEFHVDGFRFDLMGILDLHTMQDIREEMGKINPEIILYGEGWAADRSPMPENQRAVKNNTPQLPGIASFNDDFRDALKGNHGDKKSKGFVSGLVLREEAVKFGVTGAVYHPQINYDYIESLSVPWANEPGQCINYVSCHDNYTLWDKLKQSLPKESDENLRKRMKLAGALVLTSQGVPLLHAGVDFCRSKGGNGNSYKSLDAVNQLDWARKEKYIDVFNYYRDLIELRKKHPAFRLSSSKQIRSSLNFCTQYKIGVVAYCIDGSVVKDTWSKIIVIFNGNAEQVSIPLPEGKYLVKADENRINEDSTIEATDFIDVEPISMKILVQEENN